MDGIHFCEDESAIVCENVSLFAGGVVFGFIVLIKFIVEQLRQDFNVLCHRK